MNECLGGKVECCKCVDLNSHVVGHLHSQMRPSTYFQSSHFTSM